MKKVQAFQNVVEKKVVEKKRWNPPPQPIKYYDEFEVSYLNNEDIPKE